jgi:hypothetical protein
MSALLAQLPPLSPGTGTEWMIVLSIVAPILLLVVILWYGSRNTV